MKGYQWTIFTLRSLRGWVPTPQAMRRFLLTIFALLDMAIVGRFYYVLQWPDYEIMSGGEWYFYPYALAQFFGLIAIVIAAVGLCYEKRWAAWAMAATFFLRIPSEWFSLGFLDQWDFFATGLDIDTNQYGLPWFWTTGLVVALGFETLRFLVTLWLAVRWNKGRDLASEK